jgi:hypothetical protein
LEIEVSEMKALTCAALVLSTALSITGPALAGQVAGVVYRVAPGAAQPKAEAGDSVYVLRMDVGDQQTPNWRGPSVTDVYGRFYFFDLPDGQYQLRVYAGSRDVWDQSIRVQSDQSRPVRATTIVLPSN